MFPKHRITGDQTEIPRRIFFASEFKFISLGRAAEQRKFSELASSSLVLLCLLLFFFSGQES